VYDAGGRWFGVALSGFGILYNRALVDRLRLPAPQTWEDLARPEFLSWIASGDPRSSGSVHMCYEIILQAYGFQKGWGILTRLCANVRNFGEGGGVAPREVAAGEVAAGMAIDQYAQTVMDSVGGEALAFVLPRGATVINADPIALIRGAGAPELGRLFVDYTLSDEGQRILFRPAGVNGQLYSLYRLPVVKSLYEEAIAPRTRPYEYTGSFDYDTARGGRRWRLLNDLIGVWLIDAHEDLVQAWKAVIRGGTNPAAVRRLCEPPVPEAEADRLADGWDDPRLRLEVMNRWGGEAKGRYRDISRSL
jgi:ABC-type Fe3+ transport system substrate-binding protein